MRNILPILLVFLSFCSEEKVVRDMNYSVSADSIATQESWDSKILFTESGKLNAILFADHISMYSDKNLTLIDGVHLDFYNNEGEKTTVLTSKKGRVNELTKNMFAIDSVVAVSDSGVTLLTDKLMWRNRDKKILTDEFVTILTDTEKIEGYGFESDQNMKNYTIFNITYITQLK